MIITKTPFRISFFGGGTDIEDFFRCNGGSVLSTTIDKYCYVILRELPPFFDYRTEIVYSDIERVKEIEELNHPLVRNAMQYMGVDNIRLSYEADLPARSGLGSSSSFAVGILNAFHLMKGEHPNKRQLADEAIHLERDLCQEAGGWQDQIAASFGGLNRIDFGPNGYEVHPLNISMERSRCLNDRLMLFFTGFTRNSSEMQKVNHITSTENRGRLKDILALVDQGEEILTDPNRDWDDFGRLLDEAWRLKRGIGSQISTNHLDEIYQRAISAGALGGKLLGAGGGGFFLFYVTPEYQKAVQQALSPLLQVPFRFENNGAQLVHMPLKQGVNV